jgi:hypothetical protein
MWSMGYSRASFGAITLLNLSSVVVKSFGLQLLQLDCDRDVRRYDLPFIQLRTSIQ